MWCLIEQKNIKNNKERLRGQTRDKYRNMSEEKKQKVKEYQKNYCEAKKLLYILVK